MAHRRRQEEVREYHLPPPVIAEPPMFEPPEPTPQPSTVILYEPVYIIKEVEVIRYVEVGSTCPIPAPSALEQAIGASKPRFSTGGQPAPAKPKPRKRIVPAAPNTGGCH